MFERFTEQARSVVVGAQEQARAMRHPYIGTEHLLLALLDPAVGAPASLLREAGLDTATARAAVQRHLALPRPAFTHEDAEALRTIGIDLQAVLSRLEETLGSEALAVPSAGVRRRGLLRRRARGVARPNGHLPFSGRAKKVLGLALREAVALRHEHISSEHVLLGLIREGDGLAAIVLTEAGVDLDALRLATVHALDEAA